MITSILYGGLGNQMLHYAIGLGQALRHGTTHRMDLSMYRLFQSRPWMREYELSRIFELPSATETANSNALKKAELLYLMSRKNHWDGKVFQRLFNIVDIADTEDKSKLINKNTTLYGLDHSIRYFKDYLPKIRSEFAFKHPLEGENKAVSDSIRSHPSVSLHVRRGDYLNSTNIKSYAQIDIEWYHQAINIVRGFDNDVSLFVFSDDIPWCRQAFAQYDSATFIDWNHGEHSYRDMQLMSLCKYNIVANSSFSRMAALINTQTDHKVVCPSQYMIDKHENQLYFTMLPQNWIVL